MANLDKWTNLYPQGTKEGDEEQKLFVSLARHFKWPWRSLSALHKETGLSKERIEQILLKYQKQGIVFQSPTNVDYYGYWERVPEMLVKDNGTIVNNEQNDRIKKAKS